MLLSSLPYVGLLLLLPNIALLCNNNLKTFIEVFQQCTALRRHRQVMLTLSSAAKKCKENSGSTQFLKIARLSARTSVCSSKWLLTLTLSSSDQEMHGKFNFYWFLPAKLSIERSATQFQLIGCPDWFLRLNRMILSDGKPQVQQWLITTEPGQSFMNKKLWK